MKGFCQDIRVLDKILKVLVKILKVLVKIFKGLVKAKILVKFSVFPFFRFFLRKKQKNGKTEKRQFRFFVFPFFRSSKTEKTEKRKFRISVFLFFLEKKQISFFHFSIFCRGWKKKKRWKERKKQEIWKKLG